MKTNKKRRLVAVLDQDKVLMLEAELARESVRRGRKVTRTEWISGMLEDYLAKQKAKHDRRTAAK